MAAGLGNVLFVGSLLWAAGFLGLLVGTGASAEQMPLLIGIAAVVVLIGFGFKLCASGRIKLAAGAAAPVDHIEKPRRVEARDGALWVFKRSLPGVGRRMDASGWAMPFNGARKQSTAASNVTSRERHIGHADFSGAPRGDPCDRPTPK